MISGSASIKRDLTQGVLYAWGRNVYGQLGLQSTQFTCKGLGIGQYGSWY